MSHPFVEEAVAKYREELEKAVAAGRQPFLAGFAICHYDLSHRTPNVCQGWLTIEKDLHERADKAVLVQELKNILAAFSTCVSEEMTRQLGRDA